MGIGDIWNQLTAFWDSLPDSLKNVVAYAFSGFVIGFLTAFVGTEGQTIDFISALKGALIVGAYRAAAEVLTYLTKPKTTKTTASGGAKKTAVEPVKPTMANRLL